MNTKKLIALFIVVVLMISLVFSVGTVKAEEPVIATNVAPGANVFAIGEDIPIELSVNDSHLFIGNELSYGFYKSWQYYPNWSSKYINGRLHVRFVIPASVVERACELYGSTLKVFIHAGPYAYTTRTIEVYDNIAVIRIYQRNISKKGWPVVLIDRLEAVPLANIQDLQVKYFKEPGQSEQAQLIINESTTGTTNPFIHSYQFSSCSIKDRQLIHAMPIVDYFFTGYRYGYKIKVIVTASATYPLKVYSQREYWINKAYQYYINTGKTEMGHYVPGACWNVVFKISY